MPETQRIPAADFANSRGEDVTQSFEFLFCPEVDATRLKKRAPHFDTPRKCWLQDGLTLTPLEADFDLHKWIQGRPDRQLHVPETEVANAWRWDIQRVQRFLQWLVRKGAIVRVRGGSGPAGVTYEMPNPSPTAVWPGYAAIAKINLRPPGQSHGLASTWGCISSTLLKDTRTVNFGRQSMKSATFQEWTGVSYGGLSNTASEGTGFSRSRRRTVRSAGSTRFRTCTRRHGSGSFWRLTNRSGTGTSRSLRCGSTFMSIARSLRRQLN